MKPAISLHTGKLCLSIIALALASGCGTSLRYRVDADALRHHRNGGNVRNGGNGGNVAVADIVDGRGYHTALVDDHDLASDMADLRQAVRDHASALGLATGGSWAAAPSDVAMLDRQLSLAAAARVDALIFLRLRQTDYSGKIHPIHRIARVMMLFGTYFAGPLLPALIMTSIPASENRGVSTVEAFAVNPTTRAVIARSSVHVDKIQKTTGWYIQHSRALPVALRDACGDALMRVVALLEQGGEPPRPLAGDRLVYGQKL